MYTPLGVPTTAVECVAGNVCWGSELVVSHIGRVLGESLAARDVPTHKYANALKLLQGLHGLSSISARSAATKRYSVCTQGYSVQALDTS